MVIDSTCELFRDNDGEIDDDKTKGVSVDLSDGHLPSQLKKTI